MLNKKEFLVLLATKLSWKKKDVELFCDVLSKVLLETIKSDKKFKFLDLGTWTLKHKPARTWMHPGTKKPVQVLAKEVLKFKASRYTSEFVNKK